MSVFAGELLGPVRMHARVPTIFSIQETKSWDVPNLSLPGYVWYGSKSGFATLLVSDQFCTIKRAWRFEERCTAILFGTTRVMAVYAPDSGKDWSRTRPASPASSASSVKGEERRCQKVLYHWRTQRGTGDYVYRRERHRELNEIYGPFCWQVYDNDPGGYKKIMWYSIMKEFNCKVSSTWSNDDRAKDAVFTHRKQDDGGQGKLSQLDSIIGPKGRHDDCQTCNEGKAVGLVGSLPDFRVDAGRKRQ